MTHLSSSSVYTHQALTHELTGFWETAPHGRQGHRYWLFLSTRVSSVGHRKEQLWAENRWSLLLLQTLTKGRIKCAYRIEQAASCLWPSASFCLSETTLPEVSSHGLCWQAIITSLHDLSTSQLPCCSACHLGLWKAWSGSLYLCSPFFVPIRPPMCTAEVYFLATPLCRPGRKWSLRASLLPIIPENYKKSCYIDTKVSAWPLVNSLFRR